MACFIGKSKVYALERAYKTTPTVTAVKHPQVIITVQAIHVTFST